MGNISVPELLNTYFCMMFLLLFVGLPGDISNIFMSNLLVLYCFLCWLVLFCLSHFFLVMLWMQVLWTTIVMECHHLFDFWLVFAFCVSMVIECHCNGPNATCVTSEASFCLQMFSWQIVVFRWNIWTRNFSQTYVLSVLGCLPFQLRILSYPGHHDLKKNASFDCQDLFFGQLMSLGLSMLVSGVHLFS